MSEQKTRKVNRLAWGHTAAAGAGLWIGPRCGARALSLLHVASLPDSLIRFLGPAPALYLLCCSLSSASHSTESPWLRESPSHRSFLCDLLFLLSPVALFTPFIHRTSFISGRSVPGPVLGSGETKANENQFLSLQNCLLNASVLLDILR